MLATTTFHSKICVHCRGPEEPQPEDALNLYDNLYVVVLLIHRACRVVVVVAPHRSRMACHASSGRSFQLCPTQQFTMTTTSTAGGCRSIRPDNTARKMIIMYGCRMYVHIHPIINRLYRVWCVCMYQSVELISRHRISGRPHAPSSYLVYTPLGLGLKTTD